MKFGKVFLGRNRTVHNHTLAVCIMEDESAQPAEINFTEVGKIMAANRALPGARARLSANQVASTNSYNSYSTTNVMPMLRFPAHWLVQIFTLRAFPVLFHIAVHNRKTNRSVSVQLYARESKLAGNSEFIDYMDCCYCHCVTKTWGY